MWKERKVGIRPSTLANYSLIYDTYIKGKFGKNKIISIGKSDIRGLYAAIMYNRNLKKSTLGIIHNVLHQVFQYAYDEGYLFSNPVSGAYNEFRIIRRIDDERKQPLTVKEEKNFLNYISVTDR